MDPATSAEAVKLFTERGGTELDTAYVYTGGESERILGRILAHDAPPAAAVATKVNPNVEGARVSLSPAVVELQFGESLERLSLEAVDLLYLHMPDNETPVEHTLEAVNRLHLEGRIGRLGLSNYAAWQVVDCWRICEREGWIRPSVYQGMYSAITRAVEDELFPCLRRLGMSFYAYNPLAGGLLTGKHRRVDDDPAPGRFRDNPLYPPRFWTPAHFAAVDHMRAACTAEGVSMVEAALRWMRHHSLLDGTRGDALIVGASTLGQVRANLDALDAGPLSEELTGAFDEACALARPEAPTYWRR